MDEEIKEKLSNTETWIRGLYIVLFLLLLGISKIIIGALVLFQFITSLFTGSANERLMEFSQSLATYVSQIILYLGYASDEKPFPFNDWPTAQAPVAAKKRPTKKATAKTSKKKSAQANETSNSEDINTNGD